MQAHPLVSIFPDKNTQSQKKASSIAQSSYVPASCNPSSFPSNQSGPTSYTPCCDSEVINVYTSQASKPVHPSQQPCIPWAQRLNDCNASPQTPSAVPPRLSDRQLFQQAALILKATSPRPRTVSKATGSSEARVPPKPFGPQAIPPSKIQAGPPGPLSQPEALSHLFRPWMLSDLST